MATVETQTVTLTVNGREVTVPKGIRWSRRPPRPGSRCRCSATSRGWARRSAPAACAWCDIEGMPKLQTACTTPAADGMVVALGLRSGAEGQDAVLEFILLNHPLDCPVCDKGGECPLQDLTFRYGPPSTRMTLPKRTNISRSRSRR